MSTNTNNEKKEISFAEFKSWLQGVEDMQPADWAPSREQWLKIREKLMSVKENNIQAPAWNAPTHRGAPAQEFIPPHEEPIRTPPRMPIEPIVDESALNRRALPRDTQGQYASPFK